MAISINGAAPSAAQKSDLIAAFGLVDSDEMNLNSGLQKFCKKLATIAAGTVSQASVLAIGDSVAGYPAIGLVARLSESVDIAGYGLNPFGNGVGTASINVISSGDVTTPTLYDTTYWPTGTHFDVGVGGVMTHVVGGVAFTGTYFAIYYAKRSGGGTAQVDLLDSANTVISTLSINTSNATTAAGIASFTVAAAARKIRITGLTGRCIVVGAALINRSVGGLVLSGLSVGGLGLDHMTAAPLAMWQPVVADLAPDLGTYSMRESAAFVTTYLSALLTNYKAAYTPTEWMICGVYPYAADIGLAKINQPSYQENEAVRAVAKTFAYCFFDAYAVMPDPSKKTNAADVHLSGDETDYFSANIMRRSGLDFLPKVNNQFIGGVTPKLTSSMIEVSVSRGKNATQKALKIDANGDLDGRLSFFRSISFRDQSSVVVMTASTGSGSTGMAFQAFAAPANGYNSAAAYANDGTWLRINSGSLLETRMRQSSSVVRTRVDPMHTNTLTGFGSPLQTFSSTDTAYTTASDYASGELRLAWNATTLKLVLTLQPPGGGAVKLFELTAL